MAKTESKMLPLGTIAPNFSLYDTVSNEVITLEDLNLKQGLAIMFICNHCPYVIHINSMLVELANEYHKKGILFIAISSNDAEKYPQDGPVKMAEQAKKLNYPFYYLYDETQQVAKAYDAACTPDLYLFDNKKILQYRGQLDNSRPGNNIPVTGNDFKMALDSILTNIPITQVQKPSLGCNIKWK